MLTVPALPVHTEEWYKAQMLLRQFKALSFRLLSSDLESEIINHSFFTEKIRLSPKADRPEIIKQISNAWSTEHMLGLNKPIIESTGKAFALHWAFPQAYYAAFSSLLALYSALGYTERSHVKVLQKFGQIAIDGKWPSSTNFYCLGEPKLVKFVGCQPCNQKSTLSFDVFDESSIDNQICQFLRATHKRRLEEKAPGLKFKTKQGEIKKALSTSDWQKVSQNVGVTTIMDLLYRKRIKSNYQDIDTYLSEEFTQGHEVITSLCIIINKLNFINEMYLAKAVGIVEFTNIYDNFSRKINYDSINKRVEIIKNLLSN